MFDVAIVGGGLSQAVLALELARKGLKVCLIEGANPLQGLRSGESTAELVANGWSNTVPGVIPAQAYPDLVADHLSDWGGLVILGSKLDQRFLFSHRQKDVECEIRTYFPEKYAREYLNFLKGLDEAAELRQIWLNTFTQSSLVSARLKKLWSSQAEVLGEKIPDFSRWPTTILDEKTVGPLASFVRSLSFGMGSVSPDAITWAVAMKSLFLTWNGLTVLKESQANWSAQLRSKLKQAGVFLLENVGVQSLVMGKSFSGAQRIVGLLLDSHHGVQFARDIVLGASQAYLYQTLSPEFRRQETVDRFHHITPTHIRLGVKVFVNKGLPSVFENFIMLRDQSAAHLDSQNVILQKSTERSFLLQIVHPFSSARLEWPWVRRSFGLGFKKLFELFPFLENQIEHISPNLKDSKVARDLQENLVPLCLRSESGNLNFYVNGGKEHQGVQGLPWSTGHDNLFFAGPRVWPSLGFYGEILVNSHITHEIMSHNRAGLVPAESVL